MKKGQTTIFIIIAVIIVVIVLLFVFLKSDKEEHNLNYFKEHGLQPTVNNIQGFIIDCLETTSKDALIRTGIQGGYYNKPKYYYDMEWTFVPYYYHVGEFLQPSAQEIESELSNFIDNEIGSCIRDIKFSDFEVTFSEPQTTTTIKQSEITFKTSLSTKINHDNNVVVFELSEHSLTIDSKLSDIIKLATYITDSHKEDADLMCINCITEMAKQDNLYVDFIAFEEDSTLVMILENKTMEQPYLFEFLNKYPLPTEELLTP
ncbi:MAG: hypothetical protein ABIH37_02940 [archaeon]